MADRDLANCINSPMSQIVHNGASALKEKIREIIPDELGIMHDNRTFWIHDLEFYSTAYNCIGINPSQLLVSEAPATFSHACRILFRNIIALTNQQSGGIGFIDFDTDMAKYVFQETDIEIENEIWQLFLDLNTYVRKGCEMAYVTLNFGLCIADNGRRIAKALLSAYSRKQLLFPNMVFKVKTGTNRLPQDPNFDLYCQACEVTAICMNPTYLNMDANFNSCVEAGKLGIMGCRTRVFANRFHESSSLSRGNIAAITINLVQLALESNHDVCRFFSLLLETMD